VTAERDRLDHDLKACTHGCHEGRQALAKSEVDLAQCKKDKTATAEGWSRKYEEEYKRANFSEEMLARVEARSDKRIAELLHCNNKELERRREARETIKLLQDTVNAIATEGLKR